MLEPQQSFCACGEQQAHLLRSVLPSQHRRRNLPDEGTCALHWICNYASSHVRRHGQKTWCTGESVTEDAHLAGSALRFRPRQPVPETLRQEVEASAAACSAVAPGPPACVDTHDGCGSDNATYEEADACAHAWLSAHQLAAFALVCKHCISSASAQQCPLLCAGGCQVYRVQHVESSLKVRSGVGCAAT